MNRRIQKRFFKITMLCFTPFMVVNAIAQEKRRVLEEVIVTAQKQEQSLIDVPASVSVIDGKAMAENAALDAQDMVAYTPNVKYVDSNSVPTFTIRGFGTPAQGRHIEPSAALVIDGVSYGRTTFTADGVYDVERVEVLRGPQGPLFGKNTVAGVLNFTTKPADAEWGGYINVAAGSLNEKRVDAALSFPIIPERLGARIAIRDRYRESNIYNTTTDEEGTLFDQFAGRFKLLWDVSDDVVLGLDYFEAEAETVSTPYQIVGATDRAIEEWRKHDPRVDREADGNQSIQGGSSNRESESLTFRYLHALGELAFFDDFNAEITANRSKITSPAELDTDFSPIFFSTLTTLPTDRYEQTSVEIRFDGRTGAPFGWGTGLDLMFGVLHYQFENGSTQRSVLQLDQLDDLLRAGSAGLPRGSEDAAARALLAAEGSVEGQGDTLFIEGAVQVDSKANSVFLQGDWHFTDTLNATLGLRYTSERKQASTYSLNDSVVIANAVAGAENFTETYDKTENDLSPKLAISWEPVEDFRLFASVAQAFKSGGMSGPVVAPVDLTYRPEEAFSKEIGIKSYLFDRSLQLNLTVYETQYTDLQIFAYNGSQLTTLNADDATGRGVELDFTWLPPLPILSVSGSIGYTEATYDSFPCAPGIAGADVADNPPGCGTQRMNPGGLLPMDPGGLLPVRGDVRQDLTGAQVQYAPVWTASLTPTVRLPIGEHWGLLLGLDIQYEDEFFQNIDNDPQSLQDARTTVNFRVGLAQRNGNWRFILNAKNLTRESHSVVFNDLPSNPGNYAAAVLTDEPLVSLDIRYSFGADAASIGGD